LTAERHHLEEGPRNLQGEKLFFPRPLFLLLLRNASIPLSATISRRSLTPASQRCAMREQNRGFEGREEHSEETKMSARLASALCPYLSSREVALATPKIRIRSAAFRGFSLVLECCWDMIDTIRASGELIGGV